MEVKFSLEQLVACKGSISRLQAQLSDAEKMQRNSVEEINVVIACAVLAMAYSRTRSGEHVVSVQIEPKTELWR